MQHFGFGNFKGKPGYTADTQPQWSGDAEIARAKTAGLYGGLHGRVVGKNVPNKAGLYAGIRNAIKGAVYGERKPQRAIARYYADLQGTLDKDIARVAASGSHSPYTLTNEQKKDLRGVPRQIYTSGVKYLSEFKRPPKIKVPRVKAPRKPRVPSAAVLAARQKKRDDREAERQVARDKKIADKKAEHERVNSLWREAAAAARERKREQYLRAYQRSEGSAKKNQRAKERAAQIVSKTIAKANAYKPSVDTIKGMRDRERRYKQFAKEQIDSAEAPL